MTLSIDKKQTCFFVKNAIDTAISPCPTGWFFELLFYRQLFFDTRLQIGLAQNKAKIVIIHHFCGNEKILSCIGTTVPVFVDIVSTRTSMRHQKLRPSNFFLSTTLLAVRIDHRNSVLNVVDKKDRFFRLNLLINLIHNTF